MKNKVIETFLWLLFMVALAVHVMTIINYQGTKLVLAITVTVSVAIFNCGLLCGYKLAVGGREEVPVSNGHFGAPKRDPNYVKQSQMRRGQRVRHEDGYYEDDGMGYDQEYEEQLRNLVHRYAGQRVPRPNGAVRRPARYS